jgi:A/G-specific adenine glycosylase
VIPPTPRQRGLSFPGVPSTRLAPEHRQALLDWFAAAARDLPWRRCRTPYRIWISEIMLQQTQAATAGPYFERFLAAFPDLPALAAAPEDEVMARWAGLGYYSRARNLIACAREVAARYGGELPADAQTLRDLPGFGPYTTAAVASLAFGLPLAVLDGNVIRVLCRLFAIDEDVTRPAARQALQELADELVDHRAPGAWNEALMELGALVCRPRGPDCAACPLTATCQARAAERQEDLPVKRKRSAVPARPTLVLLVTDGAGRLLCRRRGDHGLYRGLWELPCQETRVMSDGESGAMPEEEWARLEGELRADLEDRLGPLAPADGDLRFRHGYSHFTALVMARRLAARARGEVGDGLVWVAREAVTQLGFSARDRRIIAALY